MDEEILPRFHIKWDSWIRFIVSFICGAITTSFLIGGKSRDISELLLWRGRTDARIDRMDDEGTRRGKWVEQQQSNSIIDNRGRIAEIERKLEQIPVMQGKILQLEKENELTHTKDRGR